MHSHSQHWVVNGSLSCLRVPDMVVVFNVKSPIAKATVALKLNQSRFWRDEIGLNPCPSGRRGFRAAFCAIFFRKKGSKENSREPEVRRKTTFTKEAGSCPPGDGDDTPFSGNIPPGKMVMISAPVLYWQLSGRPLLQWLQPLGLTKVNVGTLYRCGNGVVHNAHLLF